MLKAISYTRAVRVEALPLLVHQQMVIEKWAEQNGIELIGVFSDVGSPERIIDCPVFRLMREFIREQHLDIDLLLLDSPDGNGRDVSHVYEFWEHICRPFQIEPKFVADADVIDF